MCFCMRGRELFCALAVCVDDILILTKTDTAMTSITTQLSDKFKMKDLGGLHYLLGVQARLNYGTITLDQKQYKTKLLIKFELSDANTAT